MGKLSLTECYRIFKLYNRIIRKKKNSEETDRNLLLEYDTFLFMKKFKKNP